MASCETTVDDVGNFGISELELKLPTDREKVLVEIGFEIEWGGAISEKNCLGG